MSGKRKISDKWHARQLVYRSQDFGQSWEIMFDKNSDIGRITSLLIDTHHDRVYIATKEDGVYKATLSTITAIDLDATLHTVEEKTSQNWIHLTEGLEGDAKKTTALALDINNSLLYLGTLGGLYKSSITHHSWQKMVHNNKAFGRVDGISIGKDSSVFFCASNQGEQSIYDYERRLWKIDDNATFSDITPSLMMHDDGTFAHAGAIAVNPHDSHYLYAATFRIDLEYPTQKMALVRSKDGGESWQDISQGYAFNRVTDIHIDNNNPKHLFVHNKFGILEIWDEEAPMK